MAYYAWSEIQGFDKENKPVKLKEGDTVTQAALNLDDDQWNELVESGAVREEKYPDPEELGGLSPTEKAKQDLAVLSGAIDAGDISGAGVAEKPKATSAEDKK